MPERSASTGTRDLRTDVQASMAGGLNSISDDTALREDQLRKAINARLTDYGAVTKRGGTQRLTSAVLSANPVLNGYTWRRDGATPQIMVVVNGVLYTATYGSLPMTFTSQSGTLSTTETPTFAQFRDGTNDVVYIADGGALNRWDGATHTTNMAGTASTSAICVHNERLWGVGSSTAPDSVFYSALNDGDTLGDAANGGGQIVVRTFGDETLVNCASVGASLLLFHRRGVSRLTGFGQDDITVTPEGITGDVGTIARHSVVVADTVCYFLSERGLYRANEQTVAPVGTRETPDPLLPLIRSLSATEFSAIRCVWNRATREVWVTLPTIGVYVYHTVLNAWTGPWTGGYLSPDTTALFEALDTNNLPVILRGDASGWVSLCDAPGVNTDNAAANGTAGTAVTMLVQFRRFYCGDDTEAKALRYGYLTARLGGSSAMSVGWSGGTVASSYTLQPTTVGTWGTGTWGSGSWVGAGTANERVEMWGNGYYFDVQVIDSGTGLPVVSRFQLQAFGLGRR